MNNQISEWFARMRKTGLSKDEISYQLKKSGWQQNDIDRLLASERTVQQTPPKESTAPTSITYEITSEEFKSRQKGFFKSSLVSTIVVTVVIAMIVAILINYIAGLIVLCLIVVLAPIMVVADKRKYGNNYAVRIDQNGLEINRGKKVWKYPWDAFQSYATNLDWAQTFGGKWGASMNIRRRNVLGEEFFLYWKKKGFRMMQFFVILAEPDNSQHVEKVISHYLPHQIPKL